MMEDKTDSYEMSRSTTPSKSRGGVKGKLDNLEMRLGDTIEDLKDLSTKEADDRQFLLDRLQKLEDNLLGEIDNLRTEMNNKFKQVQDDCEILSNRLTVQKGNGTAHAKQLSVTNAKVKQLDETMIQLKKEVDGDSEEED